MQIEITNDDIAFAEQTMGITFNEEQRTVLRHLGSVDVLACPGSGKTTTLVAKLAILARKGVSGICVLSHTNVARKEVEDKLGTWASVVCKYPNFVGTIQSFVDRYLGIPGIISAFGNRPWAIDDDVFSAAAANTFKYLSSAARRRLNSMSRGEGISVFQRVRLREDDVNGICVETNGKLVSFDSYGNETTETYRSVQQWKLKLAVDGCFAYRDALAVGSWYLSRNSHLADVIGGRFPFVFIDEMQDTDAFQSQLLSRIFSGSHLQRFGDVNQAIYRSGDADDDTELAWMPTSGLGITHSSRLSESIAFLSQKVCLHPQPLQGNPNRPERQHTIFLFDTDSIDKVLPAYGELILSQPGLISDGGRFVAVGAVKKPAVRVDRYRLPSYFPSFVQLTRRPTAPKSSMIEYIRAASAVLRDTGNCHEARRLVLGALTRALRIQGTKDPNGRFFSEESYIGTMSDAHPEVYQSLRDYLPTLFLALAQENNLTVEGIVGIANKYLLPLSGDLTPQAKEFVESDSESITKSDGVVVNNVYRHTSPSGVVDIEVSTIHSVKGETHKGTLLCETFNYSFDLEKSAEYIIHEGTYPVGKKRLRKYLSLAYVAMTRPNELLCLAMNKNHLSTEQVQKLQGLGWHVTTLINPVLE